MKRILLLCISVALISPACKNRNKEIEITRKEAELNEKEQQLLLKEKTLQYREEELAEKLASADSALNRQDSIPSSDTITLNPALIGKWNVKMTCTFTNCPGSAIGDTKSEHWDLSFEGKHLMAKASERGKLMRIYSGLYSANNLELIEHHDSSTFVYDTRIVVRLNLIDNKNIEGQREIIRDEDCRILYALQMNKQ